MFELKEGSIWRIIEPSNHIERDNDGFLMEDIIENYPCWVFLKIEDELKEYTNKLKEDVLVIEWNNFS